VRTEYAKVKLVIKRKPPPPPLEPFVCVICEQETERDADNPNWQRPLVCNFCAHSSPTRPQLSGASYEQWGNFYRAHALLCAIKKEIDRARRPRRKC